MSDNDTTICINADQSLKSDIQDFAESTHRNQSEAVRLAIEELLTREGVRSGRD